MQLSIKIPRNLVWVLLRIFMVLSPSLAESQLFGFGIMCGKNQSMSANLRSGLVEVLDVISSRIDDAQWGAHYVSTRDGEIYALGQCYGDLSPKDCSECFQKSRHTLKQCLPAHSALIYLEGCFLRFDKYNFLRETTNSRHDRVACGNPTEIADDIFMRKEFSRRVGQVVSNLTTTALENNGFAVMGDRGGVEGVYAIAQCWKTVDEAGCRNCLTIAGVSILKGCLPGREGMVMQAGCFLRYSTERFYNMISDMEVEEDDFRIGFVIVGFVSLGSLLLLAFFGAHLGYMKLSLRKEAARNQNKVSEHNSRLNFKYEVLERATDSFDASRKLGQGGAGSVYKGILPDGKIVAVKRLFFTNRQWVDEFFNEVNLIGGIQHKNLVKLLGCSIEGPESLLVYEYVPNRSLDQILFDKKTSLILSWKQRFDIILGIAEGLEYLHGGNDVKIIHRDIKTSNILIDEYLTPKIADFGLARCVDPDRSHVSTGIAGTLGYMAPEYLIRGQLTEKADIYAFGVLVLEVACGKKNTVFTRGSNSILHSVWKHYKANHITESIDSILKSDLPIKEASNVLQIGLLCTQALSTLRPSMSEVVQMLKNEDSVVPTPRQPPFLNASVLNVEDSFRSLTANTFGSDGKTCSEASSFYTVKSTTSFSRRNQLKDMSIDEASEIFKS